MAGNTNDIIDIINFILGIGALVIEHVAVRHFCVGYEWALERAPRTVF